VTRFLTSGFLNQTIPSRPLILVLKYVCMSLKIGQEIPVNEYVLSALCGIALGHGPSLCRIAQDYGLALCRIALDFFLQNLFEDEYVWSRAMRHSGKPWSSVMSHSAL
jgi:hypothetical protein